MEVKSGDFRRLDMICQREDNYFRTRSYTEGEKRKAIERQKLIKGMQQAYLDNLESSVLVGDTDPNTIVQTSQAIEQLNVLGQINS